MEILSFVLMHNCSAYKYYLIYLLNVILNYVRIGEYVSRNRDLTYSGGRNIDANHCNIMRTSTYCP